MKELIRRLLKEYVDEYIQEVNFDGFSEPILIPQFNKYIVRFNGTGKVEKVSDSEKIIFKDKNGKDYIFDSNDVQKSGGSPFYISLDVLRRHYDIKFKDDFVRYKKNLTKKELNKEILDAIRIYSSGENCRNEKCSELRNVIMNILKEFYSDDYGVYETESCPRTEGFINVFPISESKDKNGNTWSKLNYIIYKSSTINLLLMAYLKKYGTFEHKDFIEWVKEDKKRLFSGEFFDLILSYIKVHGVKKIGDDELVNTIKKVLPNSEIVDTFCPSKKGYNSDLFTLYNNGKYLSFQVVRPKHRRVLKHDGKYYLKFGRRGGAPVLNRRADYIITDNGIIFKNSNVNSGLRAWEFENPPVYNELPFDTELKKHDKLK